jgi:hypothetical protein
MALASNEDVRSWIPEDKLAFDDPDIKGPQLEAQRLIKAALSGVFTPTVLNSWVDPDDTPALIRNVAGELVAAYLYRDRYAEDDPTLSEYAQQLYNEAYAKITEIRAGTLVVLDDNDEPIADTGLDVGPEDAFPNSQTPGPYFTMEMDGIFG